MTAQMRTAVLTGPGRIEVQARDVPDPGPDQLLVKVALCGICASDLAVWEGGGDKPYPYSPGHEFCGTVEGIGRRVQDLSVGLRVVVNPNLGCGDCPFCRIDRPNLCEFLKTRPIKSNGGLSEYVALDHRMALPVPDALSDALATFVEPLSCALHAVSIADVSPGVDIVILGAGMLGILAGVALKSHGAGVVFVEPDEARRNGVEHLLGVKAVTPKEAEEFDRGLSPHVAIDCSGSLQAVSLALRILRKAGRLVMAGIVRDSRQAAVPWADVSSRELEIRGAWLNPGTFRAALHLAVAQQDVLQELRTEVHALESVEHAFERAMGRDVHRVLVRP